MESPDGERSGWRELPGSPWRGLPVPVTACSQDRPAFPLCGSPHSFRAAGLLVQRQGPDRLLHLSSRPQVRRSRPGFARCGTACCVSRARNSAAWRRAQEFANYHLIAEWKWGGKTWSPRVPECSRFGNLAALCRTRRRGDGGHWMESLECQIIEGGCGDFIMVGRPSRAQPDLRGSPGPDGQPYFEKGGKAVTRDTGRFNWWGRDPSRGKT